MDVKILATKNFNHRPILEKKLKEMDISYSVDYFDDDPPLLKKYGKILSPSLVVDDKIVFRATHEKRLPLESELRKILTYKTLTDKEGSNVYEH